MTRRDWHTLAALIVLAALLLAVVLFVVMLTAVLRHSANASSSTVTPRPTPTVASRSLARPSLTASPSDHAPAGRDQTSAGIQTEANTANETADETEGPVVDLGKTSTGPTAQQWAKLRWCESRGHYDERANPRYRGAYQIGFTEWDSFGGYHDPADAPPALQDERALQIWQARGWEPWQASSKCTGLR